MVVQCNSGMPSINAQRGIIIMHGIINQLLQLSTVQMVTLKFSKISLLVLINKAEYARHIGVGQGAIKVQVKDNEQHASDTEAIACAYKDIYHAT